MAVFFFHVDHQNTERDPPRLPESCTDSPQTLVDSTSLPEVKVGLHAAKICSVCLIFH